MSRVIVSGSFDALSSKSGSQVVRFLQEAASYGPVHALVWSDSLADLLEGKKPEYPEAERVYFLQALRWITSYEVINTVVEPHQLPLDLVPPRDIWAIRESEACADKNRFAQRAGIILKVIPDAQLAGFPDLSANQAKSRRKKSVMVTGTFDWLHTGHVRFFEEVSRHGSLTVVVGHDANIRLLKGEGHPLFPEEERRYMVQSIRYVHQALHSTGSGWLDAEPELERLKPDIYVVNDDGDMPEKREYCEAHGIDYLVLKRKPKKGLASRSSTALRGF